MGVITLDDGRSFKVDDSFGKLPADQQQAIVGELKQQLTDGVAQEMSGPERAKGQSDKFVKTIDQAVRSLAQGITLGYADTIAAKLESLTGIGGRSGDYAGNLKQEQAKTAEVPSSISVPGEIAGAVAGTVAGGPILRGAGAIAGAAVPAAANVASRIPAVARAALGGAAVGGVAGSSQNNTVGGAVTGALTGGTLAVGGKFLGALGDKIMTSVIRPTKKDLEDGFSLDTIKRFDLGGSLNTTYAKTQAMLGQLSNQLRQKLAGSAATIDLSKVAGDTRAELSTAAGQIKGFGSNQKIAAALDQLDNEAQMIGGSVSIPDAQLVKQAAGKFGAWQFGRQDPDSAASERVYNSFYNKLKTAIEKASPSGVKDINADLSKLIPVSNALVRRMPVADRNYAISLGDLVTLTAAWSNPHASALTLINLAQKSGAVGNQLSKLGPRATNAVLPGSALTGLGAAGLSPGQE